MDYCPLSELQSAPTLVRDRLFIGDINNAAQTLTSSTGGITHVLSLLSSASISFFNDWKPGLEIPTEEINKVYAGEKRSMSPEKLFYLVERAGVDLRLRRMAVLLKDCEDEDLLDCLDVCLDFIDEGRREGGVLVHCFAGVSRSGSVITAYLMRTEQKSQEDALESLRDGCEYVCPNDGFLEQLKLFEDMGFKVDTSSPLYKRFRLKLLGQSYKQGERVDSYIFETDPGLSPESNTSEGDVKVNKSKTVYRCKKCRRVVAAPGNVVSHTPGEGETCFGWQKRRSGNPHKKYSEVDCTSMFVEPLKWMTTVEEGALEGKLTCVKCDARLGYFNWAGVQCSCGSWITPAFQIHKNKIDVSLEFA